MTRELLVVLPGITANELQCQRGEKLLKQYCSFDVLYLRFGCKWGPTQCASYLATQLLPIERQYDRIHFLNYIRGGMTFLTFIEQVGISNLGNVIFDRGSAAEQVPLKAFRYLGLLSPLLLGKGIEEVAKWQSWRWRAPEGCRTGVLVECGISRLARLFLITPQDLMIPNCFIYDEIQEVSESHDEVYTSPNFLAKSVHFLTTGSFQG